MPYQAHKKQTVPFRPRSCPSATRPASGGGAITLCVAYHTSKAAGIQLSLQKASELGEHGIRVNCIAPDPVRTKLAMAVHTRGRIDAYHDAIPLNRYSRED